MQNRTRRDRLAALFSLLPAVALAAACGGSGSPPSSENELVVERTEEGDVTVVRNLSGSVWGGPAHLVEELSVGVLEGDDEYMLGRPAGFWLTDTSLFVLDGQDVGVRVYDRDGRFVRRFAAEGDGPGELRFPLGLTVADDGRVLVVSMGKISVFGPEGEFLEDWPLRERTFASRLTQTPAGFVVLTTLPPEDPTDPNATMSMRQAVQPVGPDGPQGEPLPLPSLADVGADPPMMTMSVGGRTMVQPAPVGASQVVATVAPSGDVVTGYPDRYSFEVQRPDGATMRVERLVDPVPVHPEYAAFVLAQLELGLQRGMPDVSVEIDEMPEFLPAYRSVFPDRAGRLWVLRQGDAVQQEDCTPPTGSRIHASTAHAGSRSASWRSSRSRTADIWAPSRRRTTPTSSPASWAPSTW